MHEMSMNHKTVSYTVLCCHMAIKMKRAGGAPILETPLLVSELSTLLLHNLLANINEQ